MNAIKDFFAIYRLKELEARKKFMQQDNEINKNEIIKLSRAADTFLKNGEFDASVLGHVLECLLTVVEGLEYNFDMKRHKYKRLPGAGDKQPVIFLEQKECETAYLYPANMSEQQVEEALYRLDQSKLLIISSSKYSPFNLKNPLVYAFQSDSLIEEGYYCNVHCEQYPYIKDFLEMIFNYRFSKRNLDITEDEIWPILNRFIKNMEKVDETIIIK